MFKTSSREILQDTLMDIHNLDHCHSTGLDWHPKLDKGYSSRQMDGTLCKEVGYFLSDVKMLGRSHWNSFQKHPKGYLAPWSNKVMLN